MIRLPFLADKSVAVVGLGKSGAAAARALVASGAKVTVWDDNPAARAAAQADGLTVAEPAADALVVWSPGIPHTHPQPHRLAAGRRLVCDIELLGRACLDARYLAVTGTNGKSTTTSLLGHIVRAGGQPAEVGGNLGIPVMDFAPAGTYVLELSSYQLELLDTIRFDVAVLLNITPDHLDRHGGMDGYIAAKRRIFEHLKRGGTAVVGIDDEPCRRMADGLPGRVVRISTREPVGRGVAVLDGMLVDDMAGEARTVMDVRAVATLPGRHNWQNAAAAYAAARAAGIGETAAVDAIRSYPGLAHRQQRVAEIGGVLYVNDSKATNADAAEKALLCYGRVYWIIGGQAKAGGIAPLAPLFGRVAHALLIGEAADAFAATLEGKIPYTRCGTLDVAVGKAAAMAEPGSTVLLSPACASWDQFKSFEHRGDEFRRLVEALAGER